PRRTVRLPGVEGQRGGGEVAGSQPVPGGDCGDDMRFGKPGDEHRIAGEQAAELLARVLADRLLAAAGEQPAGESADGRMARGMGSGETSLGADSGGEAAGDQGYDDEDDDRHARGDAGDA